MVLTPKDAVDTFFDTEMDVLVMGNYVMLKS
jgi:predicted NodU family carbamoyl transferase